MLFDQNVVTRHGQGFAGRGFNTLRHTLFLSCVQDIAKICKDADARSPSIYNVVRTLRDGAICKELRNNFSVWAPPPAEPETDPLILEALHRINLSEQAQRKEQFDELHVELESRWEELNQSAVLGAFRQVRDRVTAHSRDPTGCRPVRACGYQFTRYQVEPDWRDRQENGASSGAMRASRSKRELCLGSTRFPTLPNFFWLLAGRNGCTLIIRPSRSRFAALLSSSVRSQRIDRSIKRHWFVTASERHSLAEVRRHRIFSIDSPHRGGIAPRTNTQSVLAHVHHIEQLKRAIEISAPTLVRDQPFAIDGIPGVTRARGIGKHGVDQAGLLATDLSSAWGTRGAGSGFSPDPASSPRSSACRSIDTSFATARSILRIAHSATAAGIA